MRLGTYLILGVVLAACRTQVYTDPPDRVGDPDLAKPLPTPAHGSQTLPPATNSINDNVSNIDLHPDSIAVDDIRNAELDTDYTASTILSGFGSLVLVHVDGGKVMDSDGTWRTTATLAPGSELIVQMHSSNQPSKMTSMFITVDQLTASWHVTTIDALLDLTNDTACVHGYCRADNGICLPNQALADEICRGHGHQTAVRFETDKPISSKNACSPDGSRCYPLDGAKTCNIIFKRIQCSN